METFINSKRDMKWLQDVHVPGLLIRYWKSAIVYGNLDAPSRIVVFRVKHPTVDDIPSTVYRSR